MNLPNKLTMLRMFMIPVFLVFFFAWGIPRHYLWALVVFAAASLTDLIDGKIARKYNLISDFGKLMDPLADKLLVTAALCCILPDIGMWGTIALILILSREFLVTSIRLLAAGKGEVLAADIWGKVKTVLQMSWICVELLGFALFLGRDALLQSNDYGTSMYWYGTASNVLMCAMVMATVLSGAHYVIKNRRLFADA